MTNNYSPPKALTKMTATTVEETEDMKKNSPEKKAASKVTPRITRKTTKTGTSENTEEIAAPHSDKGKFVGGYFSWEIAGILAEDASRENRTVSKHLEFLALLGLKARGYDIEKFTDIGEQNKDFEMMTEFQEDKKRQMDEFLAWKKDQKGR